MAKTATGGRRRFERARRPEEKEQRRRAILDAARRLMDEVGVAEMSLSELARRSKVSKPNIYRYFESREDVLLQLWVDEIRELGDRLEATFATIEPGDRRAVIDALVAAFVARPRMCELTSMAAAVIERNLSTESIIAAKLALAGMSVRIAGLLHDRLPALALPECSWLAGTAAAYVAGIWPGVNPPPHVAQVFERPELAPMRVVFERDLGRFLEVVLAGLLPPGEPRASASR